jgi:hypothetical protein
MEGISARTQSNVLGPFPKGQTQPNVLGQLRLTGYFADTKYGKMRFKFTDRGEILADGRESRVYRRLESAAETTLGELYKDHLAAFLMEQPSPITLPYTAKGFRVLLPKWVKAANVALRTGTVCDIIVQPQLFTMLSNAEHNSGDLVTGMTLLFKGFAD